MIYLTLFGLVLTLRRHENVGFVIGLILVYTFTLMVYFANARFRAPILPFLYLFAGYALVWIFEKVRGDSETGPEALAPAPESGTAETAPSLPVEDQPVAPPLGGEAPSETKEPPRIP